MKKLEDIVIEKDIRLERLTNEKKALEKVQRDLEKELEGFRESFAYEKRVI